MSVINNKDTIHIHIILSTANTYNILYYNIVCPIKLASLEMDSLEMQP